MIDTLFQHEKFDNYTFEDVPLNRDLFLVDERFLNDYSKAMLSFFDGDEYQYIGEIVAVAAKNITENSIELVWCANIYDRFHQVSISLPKDQFVACVGSWRCDERPRIFVKGDWLENIFLRSYSVFALIDAVGVKSALENGGITRDKLLELRNKIDEVSAKHPNISFISFADSLLLKSNWSVGYFKKGIKSSYDPEVFIHLSREMNTVFKATLGLGTYAVIAQGSNEYYGDPLLHISETKNHISLNSLGTPFAQIMEIDDAARKAIKAQAHEPAELYMDEQYYRSLKFKHGYRKDANPSNMYQSKMLGTPCKYYYSSIGNVISNLEKE